MNQTQSLIETELGLYLSRQNRQQTKRLTREMRDAQIAYLAEETPDTLARRARVYNEFKLYDASLAAAVMTGLTSVAGRADLAKSQARVVEREQFNILALRAFPRSQDYKSAMRRRQMAYQALRRLDRDQAVRLAKSLGIFPGEE